MLFATLLIIALENVQHISYFQELRDWVRMILFKKMCPFHSFLVSFLVEVPLN